MEARYYDNSQLLWVPRGSLTRRSRLFFSITHFLFDTFRYFLNIWPASFPLLLFVAGAIIASCLTWWDLIESMESDRAHIHTIVPGSLIVVELIILLGVLFLICLELSYTILFTSKPYRSTPWNWDGRLEIPIILLWLPIL
ncbi:hypothetical protein F4819DRAFT_463630 [Hypoxylon fuscum]|nr:hypothetical protein F4819DRAFT_463630 [Hypoxylon fuscum]